MCFSSAHSSAPNREAATQWQKMRMSGDGESQETGDEAHGETRCQAFYWAWAGGVAASCTMSAFRQTELVPASE